MPKIDFDSDSAPFSGAVLPTIEDVAALGDRLEKEVIDPSPRIDPSRASTVQKMLLPFVFVVVAATATVLHLAFPSDAGQSARSPEVPPSEIPFEGSRDVRIVVRAPSPESVAVALRAAQHLRRGSVTLVFSKESTLDPNDRKSLESAAVALYPVPGKMVASEGVLLDGLRWFPLTP